MAVLIKEKNRTLLLEEAMRMKTRIPIVSSPSDEYSAAYPRREIRRGFQGAGSLYQYTGKMRSLSARMTLIPSKTRWTNW